jgi:glyoxylase-like metal-dependent hydrolase (beta-lactamase superfamily II)
MVSRNCNCTRFNVGGVIVDRVFESEEPILDPLQMFPQISQSDIDAQLHWLAPKYYDVESGLFVIPIQGFVIRANGKVILVDTCVGDCKKRERPMFNEQGRDWLGRIRKLGLEPKDIDYVICTHFHVDHVGWNTKLVDGQWVPTFPNARYLFTNEEWEYWCSAEGRRALERTGDYMEDSIVPIVKAGLADFVPMDHKVMEKVRFIPAPGHTPGFVCVDISSEGDRLVLASDLMHSPLQCMFPHWLMSYCADPARSAETRTRLLSEWADDGTLVLPSHFPSPSAGYVRRSGETFSFQFLEEGDGTEDG